MDIDWIHYVTMVVLSVVIVIAIVMYMRCD